jgi:hypothetical protein
MGRDPPGGPHLREPPRGLFWPTASARGYGLTAPPRRSGCIPAEPYPPGGSSAHPGQLSSLVSAGHGHPGQVVDRLLNVEAIGVSKPSGAGLHFQ